MLVSFHVYLKWGFNTIVPQCYFPYILWKHTNFQSSAFSEIWKRPKTNRLKLKICSEFKIQKNENLVDCSRFHGDCHQFNCSHGWCSSVTTTHGKNWHNKFHYIHHDCGRLIICWTVDIGHIQMKIFAICLKIPFYFLSFFIISVRTKKNKLRWQNRWWKFHSGIVCATSSTTYTWWDGAEIIACLCCVAHSKTKLIPHSSMPCFYWFFFVLR